MTTTDENGQFHDKDGKFSPKDQADPLGGTNNNTMGPAYEREAQDLALAEKHGMSLGEVRLARWLNEEQATITNRQTSIRLADNVDKVIGEDQLESAHHAIVHEDKVEFGIEVDQLYNSLNPRSDPMLDDRIKSHLQNTYDGRVRLSVFGTLRPVLYFDVPIDPAKSDMRLADAEKDLAEGLKFTLAVNDICEGDGAEMAVAERLGLRWNIERQRYEAV